MLLRSWDSVLTLYLNLPVLIAICILFVGFVTDRSNRRAFLNKKMLQVVCQQREESLEKEKQEQDALIHSIFPKAIAEDLLTMYKIVSDSQASTPTTSLRQLTTTQKLGRTLAALHKSVTIVFTDILGFTSMSQACTPYEGKFPCFDHIHARARRPCP